MLSGGARTAADLSEELAVSRASMSLALQALERRGLVERTRLPGGRQEELRLSPAPLGALLGASVGRLGGLRAATAECRAALPATDAGARSRLERAEAFFAYCERWVREMVEDYPDKSL